jgi:hypothetical protein
MAFKKPESPLLTMAAWFGAIVVILGSVLAAGDSRYAPKAEFVAIQQAKAIDSVNYIRDRAEILRALRSLDSNVTCIRKPEKDWCK